MSSNNPLTFFESLKINDQFKLIPGVTFQLKIDRDENVENRIYKKISEKAAVHIATKQEINLTSTTPVRLLEIYGNEIF